MKVQASLRDFKLDAESGVWVLAGASRDFAYSDGTEDERQVLEFIQGVGDRSTSSDELRREKRSWVFEYHFTPARQNLLRHLRFGAGRSALELGAGCGAITRQLGEVGLNVTAVEGSFVRARINRARCADLSNVKVAAGNFGELDFDGKFEHVLMIGVLEYSRQFIEAVDPIQAALEHAAGTITEDGVLIIAIENQLGLKYFAGCSEDHSSILYEGVEDRYGAKTAVTFGRRELLRRLRAAGLDHVSFQYPYPDYKIPRFVLTDRGAENEQFESWEIARQLQSRDYSNPELKTALHDQFVIPALGRNGLMGELANSFLVVAGRSASAVDRVVDPALLGVYYSTERAVPYWIKTEFVAEEEKISIQKSRLIPEAQEPVARILRHDPKTQPYFPGKNLGAELHKAVILRNFEDTSRLLSLIIAFIEGNAPAEPFRENKAETLIKRDWIDAIPSNIVIDGDRCSLVDQEWTMLRDATLGELMLRVVDEIAQVDPTLPDTSREAMIELVQSIGYTFTHESLYRYDQLIREISAQTYQAPAIKTQSQPASTKLQVLETPLTAQQENGCASKGGSCGCAKTKRVQPLRRPSKSEAPTPEAIAREEKFNYGDEFKDFVCPNPFVYGEIRTDGDLAACCYLPFSLGNIKKDGLPAVWNSPTAKAVRRSILDGSYSFCDKRKCAAMQQVVNPEKRGSYDYQIPYQLFRDEELSGDKLSRVMEGQMGLESDGPKIISFEDDPSCNLACPSCRTQPIMVSEKESHDMYDLEVMLLDALGPKLEELWLAGAGDPFVSRSYRRLYKQYDFDRFPNLKFRMDTNGVPLTPKTWNELLAKVKHKVGLVCLSVDATTKETYDQTRVGGNWELLNRNLDFIAQVPERKEGMGLLIRMIVQRKNFREMKSFVELGKRLNVDAIVFSVIQNWGHYDKQEYVEEAVHLKGNRYHQELREILSDPTFDDPRVNLGNLSELYFDLREKRTLVLASVPEPKVVIPVAATSVRAVAFYLPQFHPTPENDEWWGKGFTEWTNVAKAKPLFPGHQQPHLPGELGFYDLRLPEIRAEQADLAREHGIEAFCYWHYWFGGRRILERPFEEVVRSNQPNFKFMLGWANASWTGIWHGAPNQTLIEQTYPGFEDYKNHFKAVLPALRDERYFRIDGKPVFLLYSPHTLPSAMEFTSYWRELAHQEKLGDLHFVAHMHSDPAPFGCDTAVDNAPFTKMPTPPPGLYGQSAEGPTVHGYREYIEFMRQATLGVREHPLVVPNWDNTPRSDVRGMVLKNSTPELYFEHLRDGVLKAQRMAKQDERIVFIKAWNEWAEGNYIEPDAEYGRAYLAATKRALMTPAVSSQPALRDSVRGLFDLSPAAFGSEF